MTCPCSSLIQKNLSNRHPTAVRPHRADSPRNIRTMLMGWKPVDSELPECSSYREHVLIRWRHLDGEWHSPSSTAIRWRCLAWAGSSLRVPCGAVLVANSPTDFRPVLIGWKPDDPDLPHKCSSYWKHNLSGWKPVDPDCNSSSSYRLQCWCFSWGRVSLQCHISQQHLAGIEFEFECEFPTYGRLGWKPVAFGICNRRL